MRKQLTYCLVPLFLVIAQGTQAQILQVGDPFEQYYRFLQLTGAADPGGFMNRPYLLKDMIQSIHKEHAHPWKKHLKLADTEVFEKDFYWGLFDPISFSSLNTHHPRGHNDGALWQGKGLNTHFSAGGFLSFKGVTLSVRPNINYSQNQDFLLSNWSFKDNNGKPLIYYPRRNIDAPQRFGTSEYVQFDWGQTSLRYDWRKLGIGIGREHMWWGPGQQASILMSNNAAGFWHGHIGTNAPVKTRLGEIETKLFWGFLEQSDFYRETLTSQTNYTLGRTRTITGFTLQYNPRFMPDLYVGATRIFYQYVDIDGFKLSHPFRDILNMFQPFKKESVASEDNPRGNDEADQMLSLYVRWLLKEYNAEIYLEYARNDHSWNLRDILQEPNHSGAYLFGVQKSIPLTGQSWLAFRGELVHLEQSRSHLLRPTPTYYEHHIVRHGYTHRGQVIGSWTGPGSNAQYFSADYLSTWGSAGLVIERVVFDNDLHYSMRGRNAFEDGVTFESHRVDMGYGVQATLLKDPLLGCEWHVRALIIDAYSFANRHKYQGAPWPVPPGYDWDRVDKRNYHLSLTLRRPIGGFR